MKIIHISVAILLPFCSYSQEAGKVAFIDKTINPGEVIDELPIPPPILEGQFYLDEQWHSGILSLKNNKAIELKSMRFDLRNNMLEIKLDGDIKICALGLLSNFKLSDGKEYHNLSMISNEFPVGIGRILFEGEKTVLIERTYLEVKESTYNVALDMGTRNHQSILKTQYYLMRNGRVSPIKTKFKKNKELFKERYQELNDYASANDLQSNNIENVIAILKFYDSL